ncbi:MAG: L-glutamine---4-(methylsulfanyl)-2-oxobutanoate aminotransferase [Archaeoglobi archaeon]|nr:L-glutamine---4-(methylsulfanyl)-2-oxobutanoate aminotransferase [Archaeoglobi archaeon]
MKVNRLSERVNCFTESVIRDMTRVAIKYGAINLAQGFPDFEAPEELKKAASKAIFEDYNQYTITWGLPELREAISEKVRKYNGIESDPEKEITVTCGTTEAMMATMLALINPGDEVIVFEPFYENYGPDAVVSGARLKYVALKGENFEFDEEELKEAFSKKTKAIIVNTPHNPTGKVFKMEELKLIADLCEDYDVIAVTDEVYEHLVYDGNSHISIASIGSMKDRTVTISGVSKSYSVTGWRIGYAIAPEDITLGIRRAHDFLTVGAPAPLQKASVTALRLPESYYEELVQMYDRKRRILFEALKSSGFRCKLPEGAYYIFAEFPEDAGMDDVEFSLYLTKEIGVAPVPGTTFYHTKELGKRKIRFTFSKKDETLREASGRLKKLRI